MRATRFLVCLLAMFATDPLFAGESEASAALDAVEKALRPVLEKLDPKPEVTRSNEEQSLEIAYKARMYKVHGRNKVGEVSPEPRDVRGPGNEGFVLQVSVEKAGSPHRAETPQTHKEPYWQTYLDITPLAGSQWQLYWSYSYNGGTNPDLLSQIQGKMRELKDEAEKANRPGAD